MEKQAKVLNHFRKADPVLFSHASYGDWFEVLVPRQPREYFASICKEIVYQQLSDKAGNAIFLRVASLFPRRTITVDGVSALSEDQLRGAGISRSKAMFIKGLGRDVRSGAINLSALTNLDNESVIGELTKVKGIGRWTAEMFLMFTLGREDVFSHGDLGLKNAMKKIYAFRKEPSHKRVETITSRWSPYRTYGCLVLWGVVDTKKNINA